MEEGWRERVKVKREERCSVREREVEGERAGERGNVPADIIRVGRRAV